MLNGVLRVQVVEALFSLLPQMLCSALWKGARSLWRYRRWQSGTKEASEKRMDGMKDELPFTNSPSHSRLLSAALVAGSVKARGGGSARVVGTDSPSSDKVSSDSHSLIIRLY